VTDPEAGDRRWLDAAARIATPWLGTTAENPTVGALVVRDGLLLGRGVTAAGGRPHAEPQALAMAGEGAHGATLYVTLEPCNHWGRTPPCVDAVIAAGVARVVTGLVDPDPRTAGQSLAKLQAAGIETSALDHAPSRRLHEGFLSRVTRGRPFVTLKLAVSADSMVGRADRGQVPITGDAAGRWTHMQRALSDAVLVGGSTAAIDNPLLTVRLPGLAARTPLRLVLAGRSPLPADLILFVSQPAHPVAVIGQAGALLPEGVPLWVPRDAGIAAALELIAGHGVSRLLVEPGARLCEALLASGLVDRFHLLTSAITVGPGGVPATVHGALADRLAAAGLVEVDRRALGPDMLATFERGA
jgi:diaminohydroxyphosphoribosylaminopyrimidine deaminase/5-amino-6-(5-phosphoribosylamino)uracil reductase